nr:kinesin-like protein kin-14h [Quercus suber]
MRLQKRVKNLITFSKAIKAGGQGVDLHLKGKVYHFTVDERFSEDASQEDIYKEISPLMQTAHDGSKVSIFAYGPTGSGKTHTMVGREEDFEQRGLIPRSLEQIFDTSQSHKKSGWTYKVEVSMVELSRHGYFDLSSKEDKIETPNLLKKVDVSCSKDALQHFRMAIARRSKRSMKMNDAASRSHFFFTVYIHGKNEDPMLTSEGVLHFIDLAGSEPMDNTYHSQLDNPNVDSYEESKFIKGSLFDLRPVLRGLVAKPAGARFFYKQRLFKYLQYYLEGSKIVMLANVSSSASSIIKSKLTLNFANEMFDAYGNHVSKGLEVQLDVDGFHMLDQTDQIGRKRKVDDNGCIDLGGLLKVIAGFGSKASLSVLSGHEVVFKQELQIENRELRIASRVPEFCTAGTELENIIFDIVNSESDVDETIHDEDKYGQSHTLTIKSNGIFSFEASHSCLPELNLSIQAPKVEYDDIQSPSIDGNVLLLQDSSSLKQVEKLMVYMINNEKSFKRILLPGATKLFLGRYSWPGCTSGYSSHQQVSRILAEYLGEDQMLAVVCRSFVTATALENYEENGEVDCGQALHAAAAAHGNSINSQFLVMCLEDLGPYSGKYEGSDPQRKLASLYPTLPRGNVPRGFIGYAVNMIDLDIDHLHTRTAAGHGLRETVLYRLLGEVQVYETRECMLEARRCIKYDLEEMKEHEEEQRSEGDLIISDLEQKDL